MFTTTTPELLKFGGGASPRPERLAVNTAVITKPEPERRFVPLERPSELTGPSLRISQVRLQRRTKVIDAVRDALVDTISAVSDRMPVLDCFERMAADLRRGVSYNLRVRLTQSDSGVKAELAIKSGRGLEQRERQWAIHEEVGRFLMTLPAETSTTKLRRDARPLLEIDGHQALGFEVVIDEYHLEANVDVKRDIGAAEGHLRFGRGSAYVIEAEGRPDAGPDAVPMDEFFGPVSCGAPKGLSCPSWEVTGFPRIVSSLAQACPVPASTMTLGRTL